MSARNMAKRTAAGTLALAVCLGGGALAFAGAANADANFKFDTRISGDDRYLTAIEVSKKAFPEDGKTANVILVNGYATVDGLTASYLAGVANAPILYVDEKGADAATKAEIKRLGAKNVWLVGGTAKIPTSVEDAIKGDGYTVTRVSGKDRYETAAAISEAGIKLNGGKKPSKVIVASGTSMADALAVSPVAFAKGYSIILTEKDKTPDVSKKALGNIGTDTKILVGGTAVVSDSVAKDLTITKRVSGADRAVTANLVSDWAKSDEGFQKDDAILVGGKEGFGADSLVASSFGGKNGYTLHFAGWPATNTYFKDHAAELTGKGFVIGGKGAVAVADVEDAQKAAQSAASNNQSIKVGPSDTAVLGLGKVRQYTVGSLDSSAKYRVTLVQASNVNVSKEGYVTFTQDGTSGLAAAGTVSSRITVVNGVSVSDAQSIGGLEAKDGGLSFTVTAGSATEDNFIPVVYVDGGTNTRLEIDDKGAPKEKFGLGGRTVTIPAEAAEGNFNLSEITSVDADGKYFVATVGGVAKTYKWKSGDQFQFLTNGAQVNTTSDAFFKALSVGDSIQGTYSKSGASVLALRDDAPVAPSSLTAAAPSTNTDSSVVLTIADSATKSVASYNVYRVNNTELAAPNSGDALSEKFVKVGNIADGSLGKASTGSVKFTDTGLAASNTYHYAVKSVDASGQEGATVRYATNVQTTAATVAVTPTSSNIAYGDAGTANVLDKGDVIAATFNGGPIKVADDYSVNVVDVDGTIGQLNSSNSTATVSGSDKNIVTFTLTGSPLVQKSGTTPTINITANAGNQIQSATGISNAQGAWNVVASTRNFNGTFTLAAPAVTSAVASTSTVTYSGITAGNRISVYDASGKLLGSKVSTGTSGTIVTDAPFKSNDTLRITQTATASNSSFEGSVTTIDGTTVASVALSGTGLDNAGALGSAATYSLSATATNVFGVNAVAGSTVYLKEVAAGGTVAAGPSTAGPTPTNLTSSYVAFTVGANGTVAVNYVKGTGTSGTQVITAAVDNAGTGATTATNTR